MLNENRLLDNDVCQWYHVRACHFLNHFRLQSVEDSYKSNCLQFFNAQQSQITFLNVYVLNHPRASGGMSKVLTILWDFLAIVNLQPKHQFNALVRDTNITQTVGNSRQNCDHHHGIQTQAISFKTTRPGICGSLYLYSSSIKKLWHIHIVCLLH